jgi:hypothetical protein
MRLAFVGAALGVAVFSVPALSAQSSPPPKKMFVQAELISPVRTKKAKVGDSVTAQTITPLVLGDGTVVPAGSKVLGHVREVESKATDSHSSSLAISFEQIEVKKGQILPLNLAIQAAVAGPPPVTTGQSSHVASPSAGPLPDHPLQGHASAPGGVGGGDAAELSQDSVTRRPGGEPQEKAQPKETAAHTESVVGMPGVTLQVADAPPYASTFDSNKKDFQLEAGLQLMLLIVP